MSDGTVAFRAGSRDYGVAMKGLKHLSTGFYVAASMDEPGDSIRMTYLGSLGNFFFFWGEGGFCDRDGNHGTVIKTDRKFRN